MEVLSEITYQDTGEMKIAVYFAGGVKQYVYLCDFKVKKGDLVVVYAKGEYKVVTVQAIRVKTSFKGQLKSVIDVVDVKRFKNLQDAKEKLQDFREEERQADEEQYDKYSLERQVSQGEITKKQGKLVAGLMRKIKALKG